jgi:hypothetical protein
VLSFDPHVWKAFFSKVWKTPQLHFTGLGAFASFSFMPFYEKRFFHILMRVDFIFKDSLLML